MLKTTRRDTGVTHYLTAIIEREGEGYVALCPELDVASQGETVEEARHNLVEALELFFECADPSEIESRLRDDSATILTTSR
jgi:predicted RNase H-like HicB family nuclease